MNREARRARVRARLTGHGLDALLVTRLVNVRYLTGFTGSAGTLLLTADGSGEVFVTDDRYREQAAAEVGDLDRVVTRGMDWLPERVATGEVLGLESHAIPWDHSRVLAGSLPQVRVVPAPHHVEQVRQVKEAGELALLGEACALADAAFVALLDWLRPGLSEREVARRLERDLVERGAESPAFPAIVAAGPNAARPHHRPGDRPVAVGDVVVLDFGAAVDGYRSDMTRTVALGSPPEELGAVHDVVRAAQREGVRAAVAGARAGAVDAACRTVITAAGYGAAFVHPTGHALGLEIHEEPVLRQDAADTLRAGMAVTVEPGVYLPDLGGVRIEDTVAVRPPTPTDSAQPDVLTRAPRDLIRLPAGVTGRPRPNP